MEVNPIVRVIDNFVTNRSLTNVFEGKVGENKLIFSSDLKNRPVARQLRHSLLQYMESDTFNHSKSVAMEDLQKMRLRENGNGFSTKDINH